MSQLKQIDPEIFSLIEQEKNRQETTIDLIASENYAPQAILEATGTVLTNKYAEGLPGKRYYGGCEIVDKIEMVAQERCKKLFGAQHVNVQPHAGSQANMAVYAGMLNLGDTIMGMSLAEGGHLTHGHKANFSGKLFNSVQYTVNRETERLDYDEIEQLALQYKPRLIIAGASAYSREIDFERFAKIAKRVGAFLMADIAHIAGLVAAQLHQNPVAYSDFVTSTTHKTLRGPRGGFIMCKQEYAEKIDKAVMPGIQGGPLMHVIAAKGVAFKLAQTAEFVTYQHHVIAHARIMASTFQDCGYRIVTGGTDNHLFIVDLRSQNINGKTAETLLNTLGISVSRSCIPFDGQPAWITSGIRIGTAAITSRGMQEHDVIALVDYIDQALKHRNNNLILSDISTKIKVLCARYPLD